MAGNGLNSETPDCPLCLEPLGWDDINFYPCACRYQICRFCWHRIRTDENGLCPHCREPYPENPAEYTPPSQEQLAKVKSEKRQKTVERKQKLVDSRKNLASVRVVQKNLVFVIGLSPRLADPEVLKKNEYFGKYGRIYKVVINNHTVYNGAQGPSVSAYVTYYRSEDASKAIQAVNNAYIDGRYLKVSFGTTKYCTYFLRGTQCTKPDCMYLHALGDEEASFTKEDMQMGKHQVFESATLAATNPPVKEQASSKKQQPLRNTGPSPTTAVTTLDASESILPATASWASSSTKGGADSPPTFPSSQLHSHSSGKDSKFPALSRASHSTNDGPSFVESGSHSTAIGSHISNSVGPSHHVNTGFHSHSIDTGSHSSNSLSHSHTSSGSHHSHSNSVLHSTSTGSHSHSNNSGPSSTTSVLNSHSGSTSHSHSSTSGFHSHSSSSSSSKDSSSKTHSSSRHSHSRSHSHTHVSHSKHSSHSHSSHGGSSSHTHSLSKHSHKSTDSSSHRSDLEREKTKISRSSGLTSPSSESVKRQSSRDRLSEHRHSRGGSSSKSNTPSQSPKSSMSTSSSSGSLKQLQQDGSGGGDGKMSNSTGGGEGGGGGGGESVTGGGGGGGGVKQVHSSEKLAPGTLVVETMEDWEEESLLEPVRGVTSGGRGNDRRREEGEGGGGGDRGRTSKLPSSLRNGEPSTSAMNVIPVLNAAGSSQFGALGVTWQAPNLTHHPPAHPEDDLGFDPWDESNKGLADLLETEETTTSMPSSIGKEKRESKQQKQEADTVTSNEGELPLSSATSLASWQEEFKSVFPNVNISFSPRLSSKPRKDKDPSSLRHAVDDSTGYRATPLAPTLAYVYPQLVSSATLAMNPAVAASSAGQTGFSNTKSHCEGRQESSEWPDFGDSSSSGGSVVGGQKQGSWSTERSTAARDSSSPGNGAPPPPPGFTAKGKDSSGPNTLSNSVNHSLWANATGQATNMYHNQLLQSWAHYMHLKAIPAQQLSRNQQQLLAQQQQYLARAQQALLMQGHPFLQATMGMQIRPGMVGVGIGHSTAIHSGTTPSGVVGHLPHANSGGSSLQASAVPVPGQTGVTIPSSTAKHDTNLSSDERAFNQPRALYRLVEQSMSNKTESVELQRTAKKKRPLN